jgi:histidyl-tRNA synthetase
MPGTLELLPAEQITFQRMLDTIRRVFERFGFVPVETPAIELSEVLLTKTGGETERQVYFVQSTGSIERGSRSELALRFDLTVPLARYVAEHQHDLTFPFRRYQIQRVYRGESPQRGRFREFYQCDVDVIDRDTLSLRHDAELPAIIDRVFAELAIGAFTIRLNNRKLMRGLLETVGVRDPERQALALREVDKLARRGVAHVSAALIGLGMDGDEVERLLETVRRTSTGHADAMGILDELGGSGTLAQGVVEMKTVLSGLRGLGVAEERYVLDLSIARGLDYYTGTVYETTLDDHPEIGSICSGGRYDDLAGHYTSSRLPGAGISIGLTRLFWQLREAGIVGRSASTVTALVALMETEGVDYALGVATRLRDAGVNTEGAVEPAKLGKQLKYADRAGIRFVVITGDEERGRGTATVRDLATQTQHEVPVDRVAAHILEIQESTP